MSVVYDDGQVSLLHGDVRGVLRELPAESVNCVVTSPPYWSLRDYGVEPTVWCCPGHDEVACCCVDGRHEWGDEVEQQRGGTYSGKTRWQHIADEANEQGVAVRTISPESWGLEDGHPKVASGQFCRVCGAWLGALGLESTPELFVAHMVEVFREVRRVLRPDGLLWLNVGDSYAGSWGSQGRQGANGAMADRAVAVSRISKKQVAAAPAFGANTGSRGIRGGSAKHADGAMLEDGANRRPQDGLKPKDLVGIPWMLAFALRADGWWLRQDIIWSKPNPMPESTTDRCTKAHEYLFLLSKRERYWSDFGAIREKAGENTHSRGGRDVPAGWNHTGFDNDGHAPGARTAATPASRPRASKNEASGQRTKEDLNRNWEAAEAGVAEATMTRNKRSVWHIPTAPFAEAHFATFPPALVEPCILAGCPEGGTVLDPFVGSGTTAMVARQLGRRAIGIDLNLEYMAMAVRRAGGQMAMLGEVS